MNQRMTQCGGSAGFLSNVPICIQMETPSCQDDRLHNKGLNDSISDSSFNISARDDMSRTQVREGLLSVAPCGGELAVEGRVGILPHEILKRLEDLAKECDNPLELSWQV